MFLEHYFDRYTFQLERDWLMDLKRVGQAMSTSAQSYRTLFS